MPSPFTAEHVEEWKSFGPKLKGKPTPEQQLAAQERKKKCSEMKARLAEALNDPAWTEKKIEKELDRLVEAGNSAASEIPRPAYLDPPSGTRDFYPQEMRVQNWLFDKFRKSAHHFGFQDT